MSCVPRWRNGNLDLLQTKALPKGVVDRLVTAINNSSSLLLKIISDILDFSKIKSEQLKIKPREFSPREVMNHISANYLPLVVRKQLGLYCFIKPTFPNKYAGNPRSSPAAGDLKSAQQCDKVHRYRLYCPARPVRGGLSAD